MKRLIIFLLKLLKKIFKGPKKEQYVRGRSDEIYPLY